METTFARPAETAAPRAPASGAHPAGKESSVARSSCWYCNKPLYNHRHYCNDQCREAMFEDNEVANRRRMIFGCRC